MTERDRMANEYFLESAMAEPVVARVGPGLACVYTMPCPDREGPNEDAAALLGLDARRCVLVLADGFGGHPAGARAAAKAVETVAGAVNEAAEDDEGLVAAVVAGFEAANQAVRGWGIGAATTLSVVTVAGQRARSYHVGDSAILVTGQRGRVKLRTVAHSPVGYAVESGLLDERAAMNHADRHVVSNMVGSEDMHIELGPIVNLAPRDTLLIGSDGLWDNLEFDEVVATVRKGPLPSAVSELARRGRERMLGARAGQPSKPDDLAVVAFRSR